MSNKNHDLSTLLLLNILCKQAVRSLRLLPPDVTVVVAMFARNGDGSADVAWHYDGAERDPAAVLSIVGGGMVQAAQDVGRYPTNEFSDDLVAMGKMLLQSRLVTAPSRRDQERICDIMDELERPVPTNKAELVALQDALRACQSLDDLGPFLNEWASKAQAELERRQRVALETIGTVDA